MVLSLASVALMGEAEALPASSSSSESCMIFFGPIAGHCSLQGAVDKFTIVG